MPYKRKPKDQHITPRRRLAQSPAVAASAAARRKGGVLIVTGVSSPTYQVLMPAQLSRLNVDETYQRVRIKSEVNALIHVLRNGGDVPDPITVARRGDGKLYIVDGQQRFWAHSETGTPLKALIYDVTDIEAEKNLYIAANQKVKLGTNYIVKAWAGIGAEILRKLAEVPGSEIEGMVDFGLDKRRPLSATTAIRAMTIVATGNITTGHGNIQTVLARLDHELEHSTVARDRADALLRLAMRVFSSRERIANLPIQALAIVAHRRWNGRAKHVPDGVVRRLGRIDWLRAAGGSYAGRFMPVLEAVVERAWKE